MEKDFILHGIHIGEHGFEVDNIIDEMENKVKECLELL